jgi:hypothetical protein
MSTDPYRERRFSAAEVRQVFRRAADLAEHDPETQGTERSLTRKELDRLAAEIGLPATAVARALQSDEAPEKQPEQSWFLGAPTRMLLEREVEGEPSDSDREDLLEEIRTRLGITGSSETIGKTLVWKLNAVEGTKGRELSVRFRSKNGRTKIVIEEQLGRIAGGLFGGIGIGGGVGPLGGYIAALVHLGALGLVLPLLWIPAMLILARTIFVAIARRRRRTALELMDHLAEFSRSWSGGQPPGVRIASSRAMPTTPDVDADADAELADSSEVAPPERANTQR